MMHLAIIAVVAAIVMGVVAKILCNRINRGDRYFEPMIISWAEFIAVGAIMALVIVPATLAIGNKLSVDNIVTYQQFLNGVQTQANDSVTQCTAGHPGSSSFSGHSNCRYTYVSGQYSYQETYYVQVCTGSGDSRSCHSEPRSRTEYANIYSPYGTREHTYSIDSSFGFKANDTYRFDGVYLDANPTAYGNVAIPGNIPRGAPKAWQESKQHLDDDNPLPVTAIAEYPNYILASDDEVLKSYSANIDKYSEAKLLPDFAANIMKDPLGGDMHSQADKVAFAGVSVNDADAWQKAVMRFNAALGLKLQGDLHVVLVSDTAVPASDAVPYIGALKAHWQDFSVYGKRALAKNAIILVLGTDGKTVTWAQSTTGMPFGNEVMAQYVQDKLPGTALDPTALFGTPRTVLHSVNDKEHPQKMEPTVTLSEPRGAFEKIAFEDAPFARASMSCDDEGETCVGFADLVDTIQPLLWQQVVMVVITAVIALVLWCMVASSSLVDDLLHEIRRGNKKRRKNKRARDQSRARTTWSSGDQF